MKLRHAVLHLLLFFKIVFTSLTTMFCGFLFLTGHLAFGIATSFLVFMLVSDTMETFVVLDLSEASLKRRKR